MPSTLNSPFYIQLRAMLVEARERAELTQAELAKRLGRVQSFVSKYELGERRLDVVDFIEVCECLGIDPAALLKRVLESKS